MLGDISTPAAVERERRSVTMLATGAPAYNREEALALLEALAAAISELTRLSGPSVRGLSARCPHEDEQGRSTTRGVEE